MRSANGSPAACRRAISARRGPWRARDRAARRRGRDAAGGRGLDLGAGGKAGIEEAHLLEPPAAAR